MGKRFLKAFIIMICSFAASIGLAACSIASVGNKLSITVISEKDKTCQIEVYKWYYNDKRDKKLFIPKELRGYKVISIGSRAFQGCTSLTTITIPDSVTKIGSFAFEDCTSLTSVIIGNGVTSIRKFAFSYCTSLTTIVIPYCVTSIGDFAFDMCKSLTDVFYTGSKEQWKSISIGFYNGGLARATIHYDFKGE